MSEDLECHVVLVVGGEIDRLGKDNGRMIEGECVRKHVVG